MYQFLQSVHFPFCYANCALIIHVVYVSIIWFALRSQQSFCNVCFVFCWILMEINIELKKKKLTHCVKFVLLSISVRIGVTWYLPEVGFSGDTDDGQLKSTPVWSRSNKVRKKWQINFHYQSFELSLDSDWLLMWKHYTVKTVKKENNAILQLILHSTIFAFPS